MRGDEEEAELLTTTHRFLSRRYDRNHWRVVERMPKAVSRRECVRERALDLKKIKKYIVFLSKLFSATSGLPRKEKNVNTRLGHSDSTNSQTFA